MTDQLMFNDSINLAGILGTGLVTLGGTADVTYGPTNTVTGSLSFNAVGAIAAQTYTNLSVVQTGASGGMPVYTLSGSSGLSNLSITYTGQLPTTNNATISVAGIPIGTGTGNVTSSVTCFVSGTLIRTAGGDIAVEALKVGDLISTCSGEERPIKWLGHRTIDCCRHAGARSVWPIRVAKDAFGPAKPGHDLFVSPGHSICVAVLDEVLIPAAALINGSTITQVEVDEVTYWHIELDSHDVIFANGLPTESYLEMCNRSFFVEAGTVALDAQPDAEIRTHDDFCRPFADHGPVVDIVRSQLKARALALGWSLQETTFADLHLEVDGEIVRPAVAELTARFVLPADAKDVWLVSDTSVPFEIGTGPDARPLGVCLGRLTIDDGLNERREIALDDPRLDVGFYGVEDGVQRWTAGRSHLPDALWDGCHGHFFLRLELVYPPLPSWAAPEQSDHRALSLGADLLAA